MKEKKKEKMLITTILALTQGVMPTNIKLIAPDYVHFTTDEGFYINIFLTKSVKPKEIEKDVFSNENEKLYTDLISSMKKANNKSDVDLIISHTLLKNVPDYIVGAVVSNKQILL